MVYHGVLAPHSGWRARVVAYGTSPAVASLLRGERHVEFSTSPLGVDRAVLEERDLDRVSIGCVVVTSAGGPALSAVLSRAAGVVAEARRQHLAPGRAGARARIAVLGARGATRRIPEGATVAVDGITGVVRWAR